jgi:hypothetical protein
MKNSHTAQLSDVFFLLALCYFGLAEPAHAYFDIGTGAFMVQMAVAFVAGIWLSLKTSWIKVDRKLKPKGGKDTVTTPAPGDEASG